MVPSCIDITVVAPVFVTFCLGIDLGHQPCFVPISLAILAAFIISIPHLLDTLPFCFPRPALLAGSTLATLLTLGFSRHAEILHLHFEGLWVPGLVQALDCFRGLLDKFKPMDGG